MHKFRILVPVSFGVPSDYALKQAKNIALQVNAMITCLHVIEKPGLINGKLFSREMEQKVRRESELMLASTVDKILSGSDSVSFELIVTAGKVHRKIIEKSSELGIDMIIMGRSDAKGGKTFSMGTNARRIVESSDIPVLTVRNYDDNPCGHFLVPLDLSAPVGLQLAKAIEMAELFEARVTVCTILHPGGARLESAYKRRLIDIKKLFAQYDIFCRVKLVITEASVTDEIMSFVKKYHPDLLILMTQLESEVTDLSIGSIAHELICKSETPVLTLTPVLQKDLYPYRSLFGSINKPINRYDLSDHLISTD